MRVDIDKLNQLTTEEENTISVNLSERYDIDIVTISGINTSNHLYLVPRIIEVTKEDIISKTNITDWGEYNFGNTFKSTVCVDFDKIPLKYDFIDAFLVTEHCLIDQMLVDFYENFRINFGYQKEYFLWDFETSLLGTLARIDNKNWKFYPKFHNTKATIQELLLQYKEGLFMGDDYEYLSEI